MTIIEETGVISWSATDADRGSQQIVIHVDDGRGGAAEQHFTIDVTDLPPNRPPIITSVPVTEATVSVAEHTPPKVFDLKDWEIVQLGLNSDPHAMWIISPDGHSVLQTANSSGSLLLGNDNLKNVRINGTWSVQASDDDDYIGFVFGYQDEQHYYVLIWSQGTPPAQHDGTYNATTMLRVVAVHSAKPVDNSILFGDDEDNSTILYNNLESAIGWDNYTDYDFILDHNQGVFSIDIRDGDAVVDSFVVQNHRYASGRFGFFNYSQGNVYYEGFAGEQVGEYTYRYDVDAMDMDFDPIEFAGGIVLHEESCRYDALGRRIQIVSDGEETIRVYEGTHFSANDLARFNTDGEAVQRFLFTDSVDQLVAQWTLGQGVTWALSDQLGSIRDLVDNAGHSIENVYYRAFGSPAIEGSATDPSRILFASRGYSELTGLYFNRTRFYHPSIGRFANRDTLGFQAGDHNLYRYALNSPQNAIDPSGTASLFEYSIQLGTRVFQFAIHPAHHYWLIAGVRIYCVHIQLLTSLAGVSGSGIRIQIPLPWCHF